MQMLLSKRKIGGSDAPVIMGVSPWTTPYELWMQKVSGTQREDNPGMKYGREMEPVARAAYEKYRGVIVPPANNLQHPGYDFMTANFDGLSFDRTMMIEIKNCNEKDHETAASGKVPEHYYPQCQHNLEVGRALFRMAEMEYVSYYKEDLQIVRVALDPKYIVDLIKEEGIFWNLVLSKKAPPETPRDYQIREDDEWSMALDLWKPEYEEKQRLKKEYEQAEIREKKRRDQLVMLAGDRMRVKGFGIRFTRSYIPGAVQYDKIPELKSVDLDSYRKTGYVKTVIAPMKNNNEEDEVA